MPSLQMIHVCDEDDDCYSALVTMMTVIMVDGEYCGYRCNQNSDFDDKIEKKFLFCIYSFLSKISMMTASSIARVMWKPNFRITTLNGEVVKPCTVQSETVQ